MRVLFGSIAEIHDENGDGHCEDRERSGEQDDRDSGVHALRIRDSRACQTAHAVTAASDPRSAGSRRTNIGVA